MAYQMFQDVLVGPADVNITDAQLAQIPYAISYVRLGEQPRATVVLAKVEGDDRVWVSGEKETLVTLNGRIVRTNGLRDANINAIRFDQGDPLADGLSSLAKANYQASGYLDMMPGYRYGVEFQAHYIVKNGVPQEIGNHIKLLTQVDETYAIPALGYRTVNHYWLDDSGLIWKSIQRPIPDLPPFTMTLLKPYQLDLQ